MKKYNRCYVIKYKTTEQRHDMSQKKKLKIGRALAGLVATIHSCGGNATSTESDRTCIQKQTIQ